MGRAKSCSRPWSKHGNSLALVIEKPILELLGMEADTPFEISTDGQVLILSPVWDTDHREAFKAALDRVNARFPKTLKKLAEYSIPSWTATNGGGVVAALVFLTLIGSDFARPEDELSEMVLAVARGEMDKAQTAVLIRRWSNPI